jgi:transcriptional regulator with XRE-family HTH domain
MQEKSDLFLINERILLIMREKGLNKNSLSRQIGLTQPALKKIERNENLPSFKLLFGLLQLFPTISAEWLLTGNGSMTKGDNTSDAGSAADASHLRARNEMLEKQVTTLISAIDALSAYNNELRRSAEKHCNPASSENILPSPNILSPDNTASS